MVKAYRVKVAKGSESKSIAWSEPMSWSDALKFYAQAWREEHGTAYESEVKLINQCVFMLSCRSIWGTLTGHRFDLGTGHKAFDKNAPMFEIVEFYDDGPWSTLAD